MTDAPERIWMDGDIEAGEGYWTRCFEDRKPCSEPALEYLRADYALALVAEAYEVAAEKCDVVTQDHIGDIVRGIGDEIRALTPSGALAARDARDKRVRNEALREAAKQCEQVRIELASGPWPEGARFDYEKRILALIEGDQTDG